MGVPAAIAVELGKQIGSELANQLISASVSQAGKEVTQAQLQAFWNCAKQQRQTLAIKALWDVKRSRKLGKKWKDKACKGKLGSLVKVTGTCDPDGWAGGHTAGLLGDCAISAGWPERAQLVMKWSVLSFFDGWKGKAFYAEKIKAMPAPSSTSSTPIGSAPSSAGTSPLLLVALVAAVVLWS